MEKLFAIKPGYCDGLESKIRSRSGTSHVVAENEMTGETDRDPWRADAVASVCWIRWKQLTAQGLDGYIVRASGGLSDSSNIPLPALGLCSLSTSLKRCAPIGCLLL